MLKNKILLPVLIVLALGIAAESWLLLRGPTVIAVETMQLSKVRWGRLEDIDHLRHRRVIAMAVLGGKPGSVVTPLYPPNWSIVRIETDPAVVGQFVDMLLKLRRGDVGFENPPGSQDHYLQFICDDNTGVSVGYKILPQEDNVVYGVGWASRELGSMLKKYAREEKPCP